ncbi:MAG: cysteine hydrolase family protein [Bacteroidia bacterium]|nr:cysteine hydrolase family protein [Bacteroidia bacterium]
MNPQAALLIIDMQKGSFVPETPPFDTEGTVIRINELAAHFRQLGGPVIHIQHDGTGSGEFEKGNWDWEILDEIQIKGTDLRIDKTANDVFYHSSLRQQLENKGINTLYITGCATDFCVASSIQSALIKDYHITVVSDGHTTGQRPNLSAKQVIDHYNWVWQNMLPTQGSIEVKSSAEILASLSPLKQNGNSDKKI